MLLSGPHTWEKDASNNRMDGDADKPRASCGALCPHRERLQPTAAVVADVFAGAICTCAIVVENDCGLYYSDE